MTDSSVIGLRVRPWMLDKNKYLVRSTGDVVDCWAIERGTIAKYSDGKSYLTWKSIYDFQDKQEAIMEMDKMAPQLYVYPNPEKSEPPQAGDLILLQAPGHMNGAFGIIEGRYGEFKNSFTVNINPEVCYITGQQHDREVSASGGIQYQLNSELLTDTHEILYHDFKHGHPSVHENRTEMLPVRLYMLRVSSKQIGQNRKTA